MEFEKQTLNNDHLKKIIQKCENVLNAKYEAKGFAMLLNVILRKTNNQYSKYREKTKKKEIRKERKKERSDTERGERNRSGNRPKTSECKKEEEEDDVGLQKKRKSKEVVG